MKTPAKRLSVLITLRSGPVILFLISVILPPLLGGCSAAAPLPGAGGEPDRDRSVTIEPRQEVKNLLLGAWRKTFYETETRIRERPMISSRTIFKTPPPDRFGYLTVGDHSLRADGTFDVDIPDMSGFWWLKGDNLILRPVIKSRLLHTSEVLKILTISPRELVVKTSDLTGKMIYLKVD